MEPFFDFLRGYWWLVFPLIPAFGAVASGWERASRRRHERRLEILKIKGELKAAETAARAKPVATASEPRPITRPSPLPDQLDRLFGTHDAVTARWLEYELDVAKLIDYPAMSDGRQPLTAAFLKSKKIADGLRPASASAKVTPEQVAEYRAAVTDYEVAFELAERDARRQSTSGLSEAERKRLATAKQLLSVATDEAATAAERQSAYKRARRELDGLISLSDEAIVVLETKIAAELPAPDAPRADT
ncbi:hypothetical protein LJR045_000103 [Microbacterium sp. LjRoot45]|uniref:hypothetical protein n=1 Tax=Microbacterium sp. LjRoot45 TaxID=3342329 RepID=UPI003ED1070D